MKIIAKLSLLTTSICLPPVLYLYLPEYFLSAFGRFRVWINYFSELDQQYVWLQFQSVLDYLKPFSEIIFLDSNFYSLADQLHLVDVRSIYHILYVLLPITLTVLLLSLYALSKGGLVLPRVNKTRLTAFSKVNFESVLLVIAALLLVWILLDFQNLSLLFHQALFTENNYWQLDPASSMLIRYFINPIFLELAIGWVVISGTVYALGYKLIGLITKSQMPIAKDPGEKLKVWPETEILNY